MLRNIVGLAATGTLLLAGCQVARERPLERASAAQTVLDVQPARRPTPRFDAPVQTATPPDEPSVRVAFEPVTSVTPSNAPRHADRKPAIAGAQTTGDKNNYKVRKGDTLYHIAKSEYGDGKKWTLIASANPGLSPQSLKTGQVIVIP